MVRLLAILLCAAPLTAQTYYAFGIDQDRVSGAADFSFLNRPLTAADRLFVRDGHFFRVGPDLQPNTGDDGRVRLFGVNFAFGANFPEGKDAVRVAQRLRRLGVNLVRLHHMDTQPDSQASNAGSTLTQGPYPTLNPVSIARLRTLLDAFKAEGIYADLNLHVGYTFRPELDGVPAGVPAYGKPAHALYPKMVDLEAQYARTLIDALALNNDPVLGIVEINNEDSLVYSWQSNGIDANVTGAYAAEMARQWNDYLRARYSSTEALRAAWGGGEPDGPELLASTTWQLEIHAPSRATLQTGPVTTVAVQQGGDWIYAKQVGFSIGAGRPYLGEVEVRADLPDGQSRSVYWDVKEDVSPWRTVTSKTLTVTNQWTTFSLGFQSSLSMNRIGRFALEVQSCAGTSIQIRNWSLKQAGRRGLGAGESLEAGSVAVVGPSDLGTQARTDDYLRFLAAADRAYLDRIAAVVRERAGALVPVTGTQMGYGGLLNIDSHAGMDFMDNHFYVDHYSFPHTAWEGLDWTIQDFSSAGTGLSSILNVAAARPLGKPYTVSEYNEPWPNTHGAEIGVEMAALGGFQNWDGIIHFAYSHGRTWDDGVPNGFNLNGDWGKWVVTGQSAWMFRDFGVQPGVDVRALPAPAAARLQAAREKRNGSIAAFFGAAGYNSATAFVHAVGVADEGAVPVAPRAPYDSDSGELTFDPQRSLFLIHAPAAAGIVGFAGRDKAVSGPVAVELAGSSGFVTLLVTARDGLNVADSADLLVSLPGAVLRSQPGTSPARPQQLVKYPGSTTAWTLERDPKRPDKPSGDLNSGVQPTWFERVECWVTLASTASRIAVYPLDGTGGRMAPLPENNVLATDGGFRIHLQADGQQFSPWYEVVRR